MTTINLNFLIVYIWSDMNKFCVETYIARKIVFLTSDHCLFLFSKKKKEITVFSHFSFKFCFLGLHFGFKFKFEDRGEHSIPCWVGIKSYGNGEVTIHFLGHYLWSMKRKVPVLWPTSNIERKLNSERCVVNCECATANMSM